jgi:hypothetical protein
MQFLEPEQLIKAADEIIAELPGDFAKQPKDEGSENMAMFKMMMEIMKEQGKSMQEMFASTNKQTAELAKAIINMPRPKGGICSMF